MIFLLSLFCGLALARTFRSDVPGDYQFVHGSPACPTTLSVDRTARLNFTSDGCVTKSMQIYEWGESDGNQLTQHFINHSTNVQKKDKPNVHFGKFIIGELKGPIECGDLKIPEGQFVNFFTPEHNSSMNFREVFSRPMPKPSRHGHGSGHGASHGDSHGSSNHADHSDSHSKTDGHSNHGGKHEKENDSHSNTPSHGSGHDSSGHGKSHSKPVAAPGAAPKPHDENHTTAKKTEHTGHKEEENEDGHHSERFAKEFYDYGPTITPDAEPSMHPIEVRPTTTPCPHGHGCKPSHKKVTSHVSHDTVEHPMGKPAHNHGKGMRHETRAELDVHVVIQHSSGHDAGHEHEKKKKPHGHGKMTKQNHKSAHDSESASGFHHKTKRHVGKSSENTHAGSKPSHHGGVKENAHHHSKPSQHQGKSKQSHNKKCPEDMHSSKPSHHEGEKPKGHHLKKSDGHHKVAHASHHGDKKKAGHHHEGSKHGHAKKTNKMHHSDSAPSHEGHTHSDNGKHHTKSEHEGDGMLHLEENAHGEGEGEGEESEKESHGHVGAKDKHMKKESGGDAHHQKETGHGGKHGAKKKHSSHSAHSSGDGHSHGKKDTHGSHSEGGSKNANHSEHGHGHGTRDSKKPSHGGHKNGAHSKKPESHAAHGSNAPKGGDHAAHGHDHGTSNESGHKDHAHGDGGHVTLSGHGNSTLEGDAHVSHGGHKGDAHKHGAHSAHGQEASAHTAEKPTHGHDRSVHHGKKAGRDHSGESHGSQHHVEESAAPWVTPEPHGGHSHSDHSHAEPVTSTMPEPHSTGTDSGTHAETRKSKPSVSSVVGLTITGDEYIVGKGKHYMAVSDQCLYLQTKQMSCFPSGSMVTLEGGRRVPIEMLKIGDMVAVGGGRYSRVFMWTHREPEMGATYVRIWTVSGETMVAAAGHYVHTSRGQIAVEQIVVGDEVVLENGATSKVTRVAVDLKARGLYNPQTLAGDIVVDGVLASTYTKAVEPTLAHAALAPLRMLYELVGRRGVGKAMGRFEL